MRLKGLQRREGECQNEESIQRKLIAVTDIKERIQKQRLNKTYKD